MEREAAGCTYEDAEVLVEYDGRLPGTNDFNAFVQGRWQGRVPKGGLRMPSRTQLEATKHDVLNAVLQMTIVARALVANGALRKVEI
jgi:hypothetical protein